MAVLAAAIAVLLWRLPEPKRGAIDGTPTAPDPAPFCASLGVLGSHWFALAKRGTGPGEWAINTAALLAIVLGAVMLIRWAHNFSPRPPLLLGGLAIDPHALRWGVIGFGLMMVGMGVVGPMIAGPISDWVDLVLAGGGRVWLALFAMRTTVTWPPRLSRSTGWRCRSWRCW